MRAQRPKISRLARIASSSLAVWGLLWAAGAQGQLSTVNDWL